MAVTADKVVVELELKDGQYLAKVRQAEAQFSRSQEGMARSAKDAERQIKASSGAIAASIRNMAAGIAAGASTIAIKKMADAYTSMGNRLKVVGHDAGTASGQFDELMRVASESRTDIEGTVNAYARLTNALDGTGTSAKDVTRLTETLSKAIKSSGATAAEANSLLTQISQGLGSGVLQGDELRAIRENPSAIAKSIAKEFDTTVGGLKKLGEEGKLTTDRVAKAILAASADVDAAWAKTDSTVADAFTSIRNNLIKYMGEVDNSIQGTERLTAALRGIADNVNVIVPALGVIAAVFATRYVASLAAAALAEEGFITKARQATAEALANERAKTAAVAAGARARTAALTAESIALRRQVDTGRDAAGRFVSQATAQRQLVDANRALTASMGPATLATIRNNAAVTVATTGARAFGSGLTALAGGPIGLAIIAVGALAVGIKALSDRYGEANIRQREQEASAKNTSEALDKYRDAATKAATATGENAKQAKANSEAMRLEALQALRSAEALRIRRLALLAQAQVEEEARARQSLGAVGQAQTALAGGEYAKAKAAAEVAKRQYDEAAADYSKSKAEFDQLERDIRSGALSPVSIASSPAVDAARSAVSAARSEADDAANELARDLASIQESLLTDAERAAKELAEKAEIIRRAIAGGLITSTEGAKIEAGLAGLGLQGYDPIDAKPIGQEIMNPFSDFVDEMAREQEAVAGNMARTFVDIVASDNIGQAIGDQFKRAAFNGLEIIMKQLFMSIIPQGAGRSFVSQIFGFSGNRASGGSVGAGRAYTVGENGRETFVPAQNGYIIPNMKNARMNSGMGGVVKLIVDEGSAFQARVEQISGPIAVQAAAGSAAYSQDSMRTARRRQSQSFV